MAVSQAIPATLLPAPGRGWLRNASFDTLFIGGVAALALLSTAVVVWKPGLFTLVVVADMWLLGFHHVVSTFTRLAFDKESFQTHRFLVVALPLVVLAAAVSLVAVFGGWILATTYLYWQWFHYTRQSWGIAQVYRRKAGILGEEPELLAKALIYLLPLWGILHRSWQAPTTFLDMELKVLPVPLVAVQAAGAATTVAFGWWLWRLIAAWQRRQVPVAYTLYLVSHLLIFAVGYLLVESLDHGWLAINVWHNAQYILFVWMYNNNRFKAGVDPRHRFLSWISQPRRVFVYFTVCLGISTLFYGGLQVFLGLLGMSLLTATLIAYQTINFHHYVVDGIIWKVRKPELRQNLGLAGERSEG